MIKKFSHLTKIEKIIVSFLAIIIILFGFNVTNAFYKENTEVKPVQGGMYTEGAVGKVGLINPVYVQYGSVTHDVVQLVFSGLTKYDAKTGEIVADLADFKVSKDGKIYTFVLKEKAKWHDGKDVTSNDVLFTYNTVIKSPGFNGAILNYNDYSGIKVAKVDNRTIQFLLEKPDSFFLVKTLTGILPEHALSNSSVENLSTDPFNQSPIGTGPYSFVSMTSVDNSAEINLKSFNDYYGNKPNIATIQIKVFSTFKDLLKKQNDLDGIRNVPDENKDSILKKGRFNLVHYSLPQYVAVFINTESDKLKNNKVRLALQLGTDKKALIKKINQDNIIDTPLLEIDQKNWVYQYSTKKANGALFETEWQIPNKETLAITNAQPVTTKEGSPIANATKDETSKKAEEPTYITSPNGGKDWKTTGDKVTITGTTPSKTKSIIVNDYELTKFIPSDKSWSYVASFEFKNLKKGINEFKVYAVDFSEKKNLIGSITITQGTVADFTQKDLTKLEVENKEATVLPIRKNKNGEELTLRLITPKQPKDYGDIANILKEQWQKIGINVKISILENNDFQKAILKRDYDLLIFGQNLGYNLDAYPYWHSSQTKEGGYNLSQFKNFAVDSLLDQARLKNVEDRKKTLNDIQVIISKEIPAVFLYSPTYYFALSDKIHNTSFSKLATTSDRFCGIESWYAKVDRKFNKGVNPLTFASWVIKQF